MNFDDLKALLGLTIRNPQAAAQALIASGWPVSARWMALLVAVSVSAVLAWISAQLFPVPADSTENIAPVLAMTSQPLAMAATQLVAIVLTAWLMSAVGRMFGGTGRFEDALLLTVWIEAVLLVAQVAQIMLSLIMPGLAGILSILIIVLFLWLTVQFIKALHGFESSIKVFLAMVATAFVAGFILSVIAAVFGFLPEITR